MDKFYYARKVGRVRIIDTEIISTKGETYRFNFYSHNFINLNRILNSEKIYKGTTLSKTDLLDPDMAIKENIEYILSFKKEIENAKTLGYDCPENTKAVVYYVISENVEMTYEGNKKYSKNYSSTPSGKVYEVIEFNNWDIEAFENSKTYATSPTSNDCNGMFPMWEVDGFEGL